jgi:hypothetical protein
MSKPIERIEWSCSEHDCYTETFPVRLDDVDEDMECIVPGGLLMEFKRILTYIINQSEMSQKLSSYGPCTIDARTLSTPSTQRLYIHPGLIFKRSIYSSRDSWQPIHTRNQPIVFGRRWGW